MLFPSGSAVRDNAPHEDHRRALATAIHKPPSDWKQLPGRPHTTQNYSIRSESTELRFFIFMEQGNFSKTLAFDCGYGYALEEYAMKKWSIIVIDKRDQTQSIIITKHSKPLYRPQ